MWQILLIAMTLTGGFWFGVARVGDSQFFKVILLLLAGFGNIGLVIVIARIRYVMQQYLNWSENNNPVGHVDASASGGRWFEKSHAVQITFTSLMVPWEDERPHADQDVFQRRQQALFDNYAPAYIR